MYPDRFGDARPRAPLRGRDFWRGVFAVLGILAVIAGTVLVTVTVIGRDDDSPKPPTDPPAEVENFTEVFRRVQSGIVRIETLACSSQGVGTGFLIEPNLVVTAAHIVEDMALMSLFVGEESVSGSVIGYSSGADLALIRTDSPLNGHNFDFATQAAEVGDPVAAIGFPIGLGITLTTGAVSGLDRKVEIEGTSYTGLLQTDAAINPGNSGGPLINADGDVVAVIEMGARDASGIALGVPAERTSGLIDRWQANPTYRAPATCDNPSGTTRGRPQLEAPDSLSRTVGAGIAKAFNTYFNGINTGDYGAAFQVLSKRQRTESGYTRFVQGVNTSFDFNQRILSARQIDANTVRVALSFTSLQDESKGPEGQSCTKWTLDYTMLLEADGGWHIDRSDGYGGKKYEAC